MGAMPSWKFSIRWNQFTRADLRFSLPLLVCKRWSFANSNNLGVKMITEMMREPLAKTIKYIKPIGYDSAKGLTAQVYDQLQADFIPAHLVALHSPVPEVMAGVWSILRETLMAGKVNRSHKEAVAVTVSKANECPFCVDAHTVLLRATSDHDVADAILQDDHTRIQDTQLHALVQWAWTNRASNPDSVIEPPFSRNEMPEMIGTAITFHYLNRMANIFLGDTLLPFPVPSALKDFTYRFYAATEGKRIVRHLPSGESLKFLPHAELPDDLSWAAEDPSVAGAFAGLAKVIEETGQRALSEPVRLLVNERVKAWNGGAMGISRRWVEEAIAGFKKEDQAAAHLALLTAFASYQVDAATSWASFTLARRVGEWLSEPFKTVV
jgi:AhpD family alkylhydroperoxidase